MPCVWSQVFKKMSMKIPCNFPSHNSRFLCNRPDEPLKASVRPAVSRSFSVEDVRTSKQHRPDAMSSFSNFYIELDFSSQHCLGSFCKTSGRRCNTSGRCPAFQNIPGVLYERRKEIQRRSSGRLVKPSRHGPDKDIIVLFWKGGCS
jgi:hypothetical protein